MQKSNFSTAILLLAFLLFGIHSVFAQDDPGAVEGTGTYFQVTDSEYLNVTLLSTEPIRLILESVPQMITMEIEAAEGTVATQTLLTITDLEPLSTYYKYQDDYHNLQTLTTDAEGTVTFLQDLSELHFVFIQTQPGTKFIRDDATGGDCTSIGIWDWVAKTCTLTMDVNETIQIDHDSLTLNGGGHTIKSTGGFGVYSAWTDYVTIKNLNVKSCKYGILIVQSSYNTVEANTVSNIERYGIWTDYTYYANVADNIVSDVPGDGFRIKDSRYATVTNNTVFNTGSGIAVKYRGNNTVIHNTAYNNIGEGIAVPYSNSNTITDNIVYNNPIGIHLADAHYNIVYDNTVYNNTKGIRLHYGKYNWGSNYNEIYNNCFIDNNPIQAEITMGIGNVFNLPRPDGGNYWSDYTGTDNDGDGFGDTLYIFDGGQDNLPWAIQNCWIGNEGPNTMDILASPNPVTMNSEVTLTATTDDTGTGGSDIASAHYSLNGEPWTAMDAEDGAFDEPNENVTITFTSPTNQGEYNLCVRGTDANGNIGLEECVVLSVILNDYDGDGFTDDLDNCPFDFNPDQSDIDGDQNIYGGDICDDCPDNATNTCDPNRSAGKTVYPAQNTTISTPDGSVTISVPEGAVSQHTSISITGDPEDTMYKFTTSQGKKGLALFAVSIQPSPFQFLSPISITFGWDDIDNDGIVDGTHIKETKLMITRNNDPITSKCGDCVGDPTCSCDQDNNTLTAEVMSLSDFALIFIDEEGPATSEVTVDPNPVEVNTEVNLTATVDDTNMGNSDIDSAEYSLDGGETWTAIFIESGIDSPTRTVTANFSVSVTGVYNLCVRGWDEYGNNSGNPECIFLVVYDPEGGFVTGGGWINSPAEAYPADPTLTGKANFGFVSKYKKGASTPSGETEFQFKVADLNFHSDTYDWLVVSGPKAMYKGIGTINGAGSYGFMLFAIDAKLHPVWDVDRFRIQIWDKDNSDAIVYDNEIGADLDADPTTAIANGSIVIHKK